MKKSRVFVLSVIGLVLLLSVLNSGLAFAVELNGTTGGSLNALNSGYAITRWPWDGGEISIGVDATVRACTTDPESIKVVFRWIRPDGTYWEEGPKDLTLSGDIWDGKPIWDAYDTQTLDMLGDWGVQALFQDSEGNLMGPMDPYETVAIKAISWHVIPEVPFGTIATMLIMLGALGVFTIARARPSWQRI